LKRELVPLSRDQANAFVEQHHRHCGPVTSHRGAIGCEVDGVLVGCAIIGNPKSRVVQQRDRFTCEIVRVCCSPAAPRNTASWLFARARTAAYALGFQTVRTTTLDEESGASLRAAGFRLVARRRARKKGWGCPSRPRGELATDGKPKIVWQSEATS
jgi:hypothetical protein